MNWYKTAKNDIAYDIETFEDRNIINEKIRFFESARDTVYKLGKIVFQDAAGSKVVNFSIANHKTLTSYPTIRELMLQADQIALDSPWRFAQICVVVADEFNARIKKMEKAREIFTNKDNPTRMKGWVDRYVK